MIVDASIEKDSVMVMSWRNEQITVQEIAAALAAVGFTVYHMRSPTYEHIIVPLPSVDSKLLSPYVAHVLDTRLGLWQISYTVWKPEGWAKLDNSDATVEKLS